MKKLLSILAIGSLATVGFSQGYVAFSTTSAAYAVSTNNTATGAIGKISTEVAGGPLYYIALLVQTYPASGTPTQITAGTEANWTYAGTATNYLTAGSYNDGADIGLAALTAGTTYYVELVGWSASLGTTWATVGSELANGNFGTGYFGESAVGYFTPAAPSPSPAGVLFGGNGIPSGFQLVSTPEPSSIALAAMGGLSLLAFRRKKA